jgi:hypothetical protein
VWGPRPSALAGLEARSLHSRERGTRPATRRTAADQPAGDPP